MILKSSLEALKLQIDIVDIISSSLELKKSGANFKTCCPFHGESTPSFTISPAKQIYHCFGCGVGGDAILFLQEYNRLSFTESIEEIAEHYNFTLEYETGKNTKYVDYSNLFSFISNIYIKSLSDDSLKYLYERGLNNESIALFKLGFAKQGNYQIEKLKDNFFNLNDAVDIGIVAQGEDSYYSFFRNRIVFPISSHTGKILGFTARSLKEDSKNKYINSKASKMFDKSKLLYGFDIAKDTIYKKRVIVIVEGTLDVILLHQAMIKTAVATLGTALTSSHIPLIAKSCDRVIIAYDGDKAGLKAAFKASILLCQHGIEGTACFFPTGEDPASLIKNAKVDVVISILKNGENIARFVLRTIVEKYDIKNEYDKNRAVKESVDFLKSLPSLLIANEFKSYLAQLLNVNSSLITLGQVKHIQIINHHDGEDRAEISFYKTLIENPTYMEEMLIEIEHEAFEGNVIFTALINDDYENPVLIPLKVREDIYIYTLKEFIQALRQKQKKYLQNRLQRLVNNNDNDNFKEIQKIQNKLKVNV